MQYPKKNSVSVKDVSSWYDYPQYYHLAYRSETPWEGDFVEALCDEFCPHPVDRLLEPACGTGRMIARMAAKGYAMTGFDLSEPALDYLRRLLARRRLSADVFPADMTDFRLARPADAAFCMVSTFLHILTDRGARAHLQCVAESLVPGGIYILGLELSTPRPPPHRVERWKVRQGKTLIRYTQRVVATDPRRRQETLRMSIVVRRPKSTVRLCDEYPLRMYNLAQLRRLLAAVPAFELCRVYDYTYDIDHPIELNEKASDVVLVLRRRG